MKIYKYLMFFILTGGLLTSCANDDMDDIPEKGELPGEEPKDDLQLEIRDFEYKAMDVWYYYNDDMAIYEDDFFADQSELNDWLMDWDSPEDLFYEGLLLNYPATDRFSWIVDDYEELENMFAGTTTSTGMDYGITRVCSECNELFLYVRYVLPNTPAEDAGIERGMIFTEINGTELNVGNYRDLLAADSYTLTLGKIESGGISTTENTIDVSKTTVEENPVLIAKTIDLNGTKVGYIMYNSFTFNYSGALNDAFGQFKSENVSELILDLRYNGGGRIDTSIDLASMITGQFDDQPFVKFQYNDYIQSVYQNQGSDLTISMDDTVNWQNSSAPTNSLNLNKVYIIATGSSASASELVMNGLEPFIDVIHIGTKTVGKVQGSDTYYDSTAPNFDKTAAINPNHKYAIQPLILSLVNKNNEAYPGGLIPDFEQQEFISTYGVLGDPNEPLLSLALDQIDPNRSMNRTIKDGIIPTKMISERKAFQPDYQRMYIESDNINTSSNSVE